ncbi:TRAP transporter permease [Mangrovicoccus algicola]|uniref:TRAP transporter fused permease subunit n=1 Tax=Mangrovicoccus algicola TaxID=2771008 RepID=A0A8J7CIJ6_9RHOB|nr:TRAP transporter fused permease subunit [Mangrovicoccus algicola]MBE3639630.1 TRAP transporter fused permease subunit [Mangrovicoccus algicola]
MRFLAYLFNTSPRRRPEGWLARPLTLYCAAVSAWVLSAATWMRVDSLAMTIIFLSLILVPSFLLVAAAPGSDPRRPSAIDWGLSAAAGASALYFIVNIPATAERISLLSPLSWHQFAFAAIMILLTLEITRRTVGMFLMLLVMSFIAYNLLGHHLTGTLGHGYISLQHFVDINVYTSDGLFGTPVRVAATYAFLFVLFGTILEHARGGDFFFGLSAALTGRSPGGPAKVAVVSSALFGTMSGSPTSDVVATGSITIPMMKKLGYRPEMAAGTEVAASTGGSLLPPVMGSAAFIMAEVTGLDYLAICFAAIVPAAVYYLGIYVQVHMRSKTLGLEPLAPEQVPRLRAVMISGWPYLIPLLGMTAMLVMHFSPTLTAAVASGLVWLVALMRPSTRLGLGKTIDVLSETTIRMIGVTGACAAAGLVVGGITMTGLASKFSVLAFGLVGENDFLVLLLSAAVTIILGLGMPTPSAYVLAAVLVAPTLVNDLGMPLMAVHMFILYYAVLSAMTPPVAVASFAAAAIAQANPIRISLEAMQLAVTAFIMPFAFIANPGVLQPWASAGDAAEALAVILGCFAIAIGAETARRTDRLWGWAGVAAGLCLIMPGPEPKILGLAMAAAVLVRMRRRRTAMAVS